MRVNEKKINFWTHILFPICFNMADGKEGKQQSVSIWALAPPRACCNILYMIVMGVWEFVPPVHMCFIFNYNSRKSLLHVASSNPDVLPAAEGGGSEALRISSQHFGNDAVLLASPSGNVQLERCFTRAACAKCKNSWDQNEHLQIWSHASLLEE